MTDTAHMARDLAAAVMHTARGDGPAAVDAVDRCITTARDACLTAYTLAGCVAAQVPGDGPLVVDAGATAPEHDEVASLVGAIVAAAGNGDVRGAAEAFYAADGKTAGTVIVDLLRLCAAPIRQELHG